MEVYITSIHVLFFSAWLGANLFCLTIFLPASATLPPDVRWQARRRASGGLNWVTAVSAPPVVISGLAWLVLPGLNVALGMGWGNLSVLAIKFVLTLLMITIHLLQAFRFAPAQVGARDATSPAFDGMEGVWKSWVRLLTVNVVVGFAVFFLGLALV